MKIIFAAFALFISLQSFANLEHTPGMEAAPSQERMTTNHACFEDLERLGCGRPQDDREHFQQCALDQLNHLEQSCQKVIKKLYH